MLNSAYFLRIRKRNPQALIRVTANLHVLNGLLYFWFDWLALGALVHACACAWRFRLLVLCSLFSPPLSFFCRSLLVRVRASAPAKPGADHTTRSWRSPIILRCPRMVGVTVAAASFSFFSIYLRPRSLCPIPLLILLPLCPLILYSSCSAAVLFGSLTLLLSLAIAPF